MFAHGQDGWIRGKKGKLELCSFKKFCIDVNLARNADRLGRSQERMRLRIFLALVLSAKCSPLLYTDVLYRNSLYEGSPCQMEDGRPGVCKKAAECSLRVIEILQGQRGPDSAGRCGFDGDTEIVCCLKNCQHSRRLADREQLEALGNPPTILRFDEARPRIPVHRGIEVESEELPYVAALGYRNDQGKIEYTCSGSLITEYHVLTAAHCVHNIDNRVPVEVRLGDVNLRLQKPTTQRIEVKSFIWHEKHSKFKNYHDIAVITLAEAASFNNRVWPICLPTDYRWRYYAEYNLHEDGGPVLVVTGWGATDESGPLSNNLIKSPSLSLVDLKICESLYQNAASLPHGIIEGMLCAVDRNVSRRSDACRGDSGGPLIHQTRFGHTIFGVTAFGQGCGGSVPGVYTAVYPYIEWIENHTWGAHGLTAPEFEEPKCHSTTEKEEEMGNGEKEVKENELELDRERENVKGEKEGMEKGEGQKKQQIEKNPAGDKGEKVQMAEGAEKDEKKHEEDEKEEQMQNDEGKESEGELQSGDGEEREEEIQSGDVEVTENVMKKDEEEETTEEMKKDEEEETTEEMKKDEEEETTDEIQNDEEEETTEEMPQDDDEEEETEKYEDEEKEEEIEKCEKGEKEAEIERHKKEENEEEYDIDKNMKKQKVEEDKEEQNEIETGANDTEEDNEFNEVEPTTMIVYS